MTDYISREAALSKAVTIPGYFCDMIPAYEVATLPAAEVAPVKRGRWILRDESGKGVCSECNRQDSIDALATHCRYCGALMQED